MLRVATLNLRADADRWPQRLPLVIDALRAADPDVIALQEARLRIDQAQQVADALNADADHPYSVHLAEDGYQPHILANALLARLPVIAADRLALPGYFRTAQRIRLRVGDASLMIANTHLHHKPRHAETIRLPQMHAILDWLFGGPQQAAATILMGDLNAVPACPTLHACADQLQSAYASVHGAEPAATFPTPLRTDLTDRSARTIDYILYTPTLLCPTTAALIGTAPHPDDATLYASDHYGLMAVFAVANGQRT